MASTSGVPEYIIALAAALAGIFIWQLRRQLLSSHANKRRSEELENSQGADYFELTGVPPPRPLPDFNVDKALPRPYRPFRWKYHQTMSLKTLEPDWWLELESTYRERLSQRKVLYENYGSKIIHTSPGSESACTELMEMVIQFLCVRYPNQFRCDPASDVFYNNILGTEVNLKSIDPLVFLLQNVPEDFLIVQEDSKTGLYHFCAGVSASAMGWNMQMKIGKPLHEVHGPVPFYKEKMQNSMDRFFTNMTCDKPIQRGSWGIEVGQPLYLQPDDPHWNMRTVQRPDLDINDIYLRVDWQTLRRLPKSQAIVFNFKALFTPVTSFRGEPFIPRLLATILRGSEKPFMEYKASFHIEHKVLPALDEWAREQEANGWVPEDWVVRTLDENPFYPGWELQ